jgi:HD superfamily phosphohydrolase
LILRDPVHGLIPFDTSEDQVIVRLLETPEVQRLRRIRQLGVASFAFPGAEHTRFAHALGSAHVMRRLLGRLRDVQSDLAPRHRLDKGRAREALAAAFLHDVGHGPLSHLFEEALPNAPRHETWSTRIILDRDTGVGKVLADEDPDLPARVAELVRGRHELAYLARAVSGTFDVDRCDYLLRDAHATGGPSGR